MRRSASAFLPPRRPYKIKACATFWPRVARSAAEDDVDRALKDFDRELRATHPKIALAAIGLVREILSVCSEGLKEAADTEDLAAVLHAVTACFIVQRRAVESARHFIRKCEVRAPR